MRLRAVGAGPAGAAAARPKFGQKKWWSSYGAKAQDAIMERNEFQLSTGDFFTSLYGSLFAVHSLLSHSRKITITNPRA